jgi:hypothetical protein
MEKILLNVCRRTAFKVRTADGRGRLTSSVRLPRLHLRFDCVPVSLELLACDRVCQAGEDATCILSISGNEVPLVYIY